MILPTVERVESAKTTAADNSVVSTTSIKKEAVRNTVDKVQKKGAKGFGRVLRTSQQSVQVTVP